jgi:hypothetical protein
MSPKDGKPTAIQSFLIEWKKMEFPKKIEICLGTAIAIFTAAAMGFGFWQAWLTREALDFQEQSSSETAIEQKRVNDSTLSVAKQTANSLTVLADATRRSVLLSEETKSRSDSEFRIRNRPDVLVSAPHLVNLEVNKPFSIAIQIHNEGFDTATNLRATFYTSMRRAIKFRPGHPPKPANPIYVSWGYLARRAYWRIDSLEFGNAVLTNRTLEALSNGDSILFVFCSVSYSGKAVPGQWTKFSSFYYEFQKWRDFPNIRDRILTFDNINTY